MKEEKKGNRRVLFIIICILVFIFSFVVGVVSKFISDPTNGKFSVEWSESIGIVYNDISYGDKESNKFDLYVPTDKSKDNYGLIVYLHAGGFTSGDKKDDEKILQYYCSKEYVTAGINYTLFNENNLDSNIYTQSIEIKEAMPYVVNKAKELGYNVNRMTVSGGSAGGCLALIYGYRDKDTAPVPVKMVFEAVGPSSFYPDDWKSYGFDKDKNAAAVLFSVMRGKQITPDMFGTEEYEKIVKDISALLWVDANTVPTVMAYGKYDKFQPYEGSVRLDEALTKNNIDHKYFVFEHSGHGLQNDTRVYIQYMEAVEEYLSKYMAN